MTKLLVVTSSVRENRASDNVLEFVTSQLGTHPEYEITVADFKKIPLPFFDAVTSPSDENFTATDENVIAWTKMVDDADGIVFLVAEYNHSMTGVLKNAIDWIYKEWVGKPVAFVGYGWAGGARAIAALRVVMGSNIAAKAAENEVNLHFMKEINLDGTIVDAENAKQSLDLTLNELSMLIKMPRGEEVVAA